MKVHEAELALTLQCLQFTTGILLRASNTVSHFLLTTGFTTVVTELFSATIVYACSFPPQVSQRITVFEKRG